MRAMVLEAQGQPLAQATLPDPRPGPDQLLLKVKACAVCRTDLHLRDHEIEATKLPVVLGHQIVGITEDGRRVGVPWLGWTDGTCEYCTSGRENLCVAARFTGRATSGRRSSPGSSAPCGRAAATKCRPSGSTRRSSSRPPARSSPRR